MVTVTRSLDKEGTFIQLKFWKREKTHTHTQKNPYVTVKIRKTFTESVSAHTKLCLLAFPSRQNVLRSTSCSSRPRSAPGRPSYALVIRAPVLPSCGGTREGGDVVFCKKVHCSRAPGEVGALKWGGSGSRPPPSSVGLYAAVLQQRLLALAGSALRAV